MSDPKASTADDPSRLAALDAYDILDTSAETGFDDIVMLATQICATPVALVSFVAGDRQWFKARIGFDPCETPLDQSVCRHALERPGLLIIPDLTLDPRTRHNTLVTQPPYIRFYAGARLETPEGLPLGTLCVIDAVPRPEGLTPQQARALEALARQVMAQMDLRRVAAARDAALSAVRAAELKHRQILGSAIDYAIISMDLGGRILSWNTGAENVLGWTEAEMIGRPAQDFFTEEDTKDAIVEREMLNARRNGHGNDERWHRRKGGAVFWAHGEMMPLTTEDGEHVGYVKILRDRTEQRRVAEALKSRNDLLRTITDHVSEAVFQLGTDGLISFANPMAGEMLGWPADALIGRNLHDTAHHHHPDGRAFPAADCAFVRALIAGEPLIKREATFFRRDGRPIQVLCSNSPLIEDGIVKGAVLTVVDVTAVTAAAEKLRRSDERLSLAFQASGAIGWWDWDIPNDKVYASTSFARLYSVDEASIGAPIAAFVKGIHPDDRAWVGAKIREAIETAGAFAAEYRLLRSDGSIRWVYARGQCSNDDEGRPSRFPGVSVDITDRRLTDERRAALVALGDGLRELTDTGAMAYLAAEIAGRTLGLDRAAYGTVDDGHVMDIQRDWSATGDGNLAGRHRLEEYGSYLDDLRRGETVLIDDIENDTRCMASPLGSLGIRTLLKIPLLEHGRLVAVFCLLDTAPRTWEADKIDFLRSVADRTRAALARRRAEDEQDLLNRELSHRMKNLLAMVQAIATQTMRSAETVEGAKEVLGARLIALSHAHDLLMGSTLGNAQLKAIVEGVLSVHAERPDRLRIEGEAIEMGAKPAIALALMLHELATNALKYGALSNAGGHVAITWTVVETTNIPRLRLTWTEVGGPPVSPPARKGFGTRFIERGLAGQIGGEIDLSYQPTGLVCTLQGDLAAFQANY